MPPATEQTRERETLHVARQPILDERGRVFGYELLYRQAADATGCAASGDSASARVLTSAVLDLGLDTLTSGRQAFLNVTRPLLLGQIDALVPPDGVVLELLETVEVDKDVVTVFAICGHEGIVWRSTTSSPAPTPKRSCHSSRS